LKTAHYATDLLVDAAPDPRHGLLERQHLRMEWPEALLEVAELSLEAGLLPAQILDHR
jgi:hypothetical protein